MTVSQIPTLSVVKRDGRVVPFDFGRIEHAVSRCYAACETPPPEGADLDAVLTDLIHDLQYDFLSSSDDTLKVEEIQDTIEARLGVVGYAEAARRYIRYRYDHEKLREERPIPDDVKAAFAASDRYFPTPLQKFQFFDKYSRFNYDLGRRETWIETVDRSVDFLHELAGDRLDREVYERIRTGILEMQVMPSMRLLAMAGAPARRNSMALYNCSYSTADSLDIFPETLLISMAGCGGGFSVERKYVDQLPAIYPYFGKYGTSLWVVEDSAEGWADALRYGLDAWFNGWDVKFNTDFVRPAGAILRTKGGRASGPEPLRKLLDFCRDKIREHAGRRLRPIDVHDMLCMVGSAAVSGGVRRTAMISLFDEDDREMLAAKQPGFEQKHSYRWNANNSAVWSTESMSDQATFIDRFMAMIKSGNGEPGIFRRDVAQALMPARRDRSYEFGLNPCGEIQLRPFQFCNLTSIVVRPGDTYRELGDKAVLASTLGTVQSLAVTFPGLRPQWRQNCEEERLLGVSLDGQLDNPTPLDEETMRFLKSRAVFTNLEVATKLEINPSAAVTCVKPSGNSSQLLDAASGIHARWAPYYIRNVRVSASSPVCRVLRDAGVPMAPENGDDPLSPRTWVVSFPVASPPGAVTCQDRSAVEQCEWWLRNKLHWTEHNPSVTITYRPDEILALMAWVYAHRDKIGGMSFLPAFDAKYDQLPYIEIDRAEYERRVAEFPEIDFSKIWRYEQEDLSTASSTLACEGDRCVVDA